MKRKRKISSDFYYYDPCSSLLIAVQTTEVDAMKFDKITNIDIAPGDDNQNVSFSLACTQRNLTYCSAVAVMVFMLCLIGFVGTFTPPIRSFTMPFLHAPIV